MTTEIEVQFVEGQEGADARAARYKARVRKTNKTQIFDDYYRNLRNCRGNVQQYGIERSLRVRKSEERKDALRYSLEKA